MKIAAYLKSSVINDDPYITSVVFTKGCNMTCPYCHNMSLDDELLISEGAVLNHLEKRKNVLQGVVISGGEPTLQKDLPDFIKKVKAMGYRVKLDTNGTNPDMVKALMATRSVDFIAMDIKALPDDYEKICGVSFNSVQQTLAFLRHYGHYELRTTAYPQLTLSDLEQLCQRYNNDPYVLQQYRPQSEAMLLPYSDALLKDLAKSYGVKLRNVE